MEHLHKLADRLAANWQKAVQKAHDDRARDGLVETELGHHQAIVMRIVSHWMFEWTVSFLITFNVFVVVVDTDAHAQKEKSPQWVVNSHAVLLTIFCIELVLKLYAYRCHFFNSNMNVLEMAVVCCDLLISILDVAATRLPSVTFLRIIRLLRLLRALQLMTGSRELSVMLNSLMGTTRCVFWSMTLLLLVLLVCAIIAVEILHPLNTAVAESGIYDGCERCPRAFASVYQAGVTFFQQVVAGDSWGTVSIPIIEGYPIMSPFFLAILAFIQLGILNLILASIVERAQEALRGNDTEALRQREADFAELRDKLVKVFDQIDGDGNHEVTLVELMDGFDQVEEFRNAMRLMNIERGDLHALFGVMDDDDSGKITVSEFVDNIHEIKHKDLHIMLVFLQYELQQLIKPHSGLMEGLRQEVKDAFAVQSLQMAALFERLAALPCVEPTKVSKDATPEFLSQCQVPRQEAPNPLLRSQLCLTKSSLEAGGGQLHEELRRARQRIDEELRYLFGIAADAGLGALRQAESPRAPADPVQVSARRMRNPVAVVAPLQRDSPSTLENPPFSPSRKPPWSGDGQGPPSHRSQNGRKVHDAGKSWR